MNDKTVVVTPPTVRIKYGEVFKEFSLQRVSQFETLLSNFYPNDFQQSNNHEITIKSSFDEECVSFILEYGTFRSQLKDNNHVILSQFGIDLFKINPTKNDQNYTIELKKTGKL